MSEEMITNNDAQYACDIVKTICTEVGPGMPGTSQERERAAILKRELDSHLGAGNAAFEEFTVAPWAFVGAYPISAALMLLAALLNISTGGLAGPVARVAAIGALAFSILAPLQFILEFVLGLELVDPFFRKKTSVNVIGTLRSPGTGDVRRLLVLSGHHDSAPENTWLHYTGYGFLLLTATFYIALVTLLLMSAIQLTGLIAGKAGLVRSGTLRWPMLAFPIVPAIIYALFFNMGRKGGGTVPGAVDNLAASALTVALCRFLVHNPSYIPEGTEIRFISFGSEEAGLRGSRCYVQRHLDELKRLDARLLNIEMVGHPEIAILTSDVNGTVKHSPDMVASVVAAAERAGVPHKVQPATFGVGTDAAPFSQAGLKATVLIPFKVPQQMVAFYHQYRDGPEAMNIEPLSNVLKLAFEWVSCGGQNH
jgi:hypothetical protein